MIWAAAPHLLGQVQATADLIQRTAKDRADSSCGGEADGDPNNAYGHGRLDALAAVAEAVGEPSSFRRGYDCSPDSGFNIADSIVLLDYLFRGQPAPPCGDACDIDDSGRMDLGDVIGMLQYLFFGSLPPEPPFPGCGTDPTPDAMGCAKSGTCG